MKTALLLAMLAGSALADTIQTIPVPVPATATSIQVDVSPTDVAITTAAGVTHIAVPTAPVCGPAPAPLTSPQACPAGTTGTWSQTTTYTAAPAPACWTPVTAPTSAPAGACQPIAAPGCSRPSGGTGTGLYVACGRLNNPDGTEFRAQGVNRAHFDQNASAGISLMGGNVARTFYTYQWGLTVAQQVSDFKSLISSKIVPIATNADHSTCKTDAASLQAAVTDWVNNASAYKALNGNGIVNIANEWGPGNSSVWRDQNIAAVKALRAAGYTMPLLVDSGGCGQDQADLTTYAAAVAAADPQHNVFFAFHLYGGTANVGAMGSYFASLKALSSSNPALAFVIGEFGPGRNIGPSPTMITPDSVIAAADANGLGWIAWAWDDNNLGGCKSDDNWFSMTTYCASYTGDPAQLTMFGKDMLGQFKSHAPARAKVF